MPIASRLLTIQRSGKEIQVAVRLFAPEPAAQSWTCRYEIDWPERPKTMTAWGVDSVQAIILALNMIGADLYTSNYHKAGELVFEKPGQGYGFPVTHNLRDMLQGDDAKFL